MEVSQLTVYPVKGCRGVALERAVVAADALEHDRRFVVHAGDGKFLSQRNHAAMGRIDARIEDARLTLAAPGVEPVRVPPVLEGIETDVDVWGTTCRVVDQGDEAAAFFERVLGVPCRLAGLAKGFHRPLHDGLGDRPAGRLRFADAAPVLVASEASLEDLNARLDAPVEMERFRANLVVRGCEPYAEDGWERITVGDVTLERLVPCGRCVVTTIDPVTLVRSKEPLRTLATYRKDDTYGVLFGTYYLHRSEGTLRVGDEVRIG